MSALARYFHSQGSFISGSDKEQSNLITDLEKEGVKDIWVPHSKSNIEKIKPDYVIFSSAVNANNIELNWAKENKRIILHRSDLLQLAFEDKKLISISGTHGKTSTSAMVTDILLKNNFKPSAILGGITISQNTNTISGDGEYFVAEGDESDKSFLKGSPYIAVITNIEEDHLENYPGGLEEIKSSFLEFAKKAFSNYGLVFCLQDKTTKELLSKNFDLNDPKLISYGIYNKCDPSTLSAKFNSKNESWDIYLKEDFQASIKLKQPGEHYVLNALASFGVGLLLKIKPNSIKTALESFEGVKRRFQIVAKTNNITIVDDYAHHPTEIAQTIKAAKELRPKRLIIVLQPHQPTRLRDLWKDFVNILKNDDSQIYITDTYIARGTEIEGISSQALAKEINKPNVNYLKGNIDEIAEYINKIIKPKDLILIMGAGNITNLGQKLLKYEQVLAGNFGNN